MCVAFLFCSVDLRYLLSICSFLMLYFQTFRIPFFMGMILKKEIHSYLDFFHGFIRVKGCHFSFIKLWILEACLGGTCLTWFNLCHSWLFLISRCCIESAQLLIEAVTKGLAIHSWDCGLFILKFGACTKKSQQIQHFDTVKQPWKTL